MSGTHKSKVSGYILFESIVAMALLSIGIAALQRSVRETLIARGQAEDYTMAKFLLEQVMAEAELQPRLKPGMARSGSFEGDLDRFRWRWSVSEVIIPPPPPPPRASGQLPPDFVLPDNTMLRIDATVSWQRAGRSFSATAETLRR